MNQDANPKTMTGDESVFAGAKVFRFRNPAAQGARPAEAERVLPDSLLEAAANEIAQWEGFAETPLHSLSGLAGECGVGAVYYKDESGRFGLGSFKALGGAYALLCALAERIGASVEEVREGRRRASAEKILAVAATDGNHGRAVAWGARRFGCGCRIFIHAEVSENRAEAMRKHGAEIVRVNGDYDESLRRARDEAERDGRILVSDFSSEGDDMTTRRVMAGYATLSAEARRQMDSPPTHVFVPVGVGGLAAAVMADFWRANAGARPRFVVVESERADCAFQSAVNGAPTATEIKSETVMAGLSCGEVSAPAWTIVSRGADDFVAIPDELVAPTMRRAFVGGNGNPSVVAGECSAAGWAVLLAAARQPELFRGLMLDSESRVLLIGTEGATDPDIYRRMTGAGLDSL